MVGIAEFQRNAPLPMPHFQSPPFYPDRIWAQCVKELAQFRRDRLTVALAFLLPLVTLLLFGLAIRLEAKNIPLAVQDFDQSPLSRSYIERFFATNQFQPVPLTANPAMTPEPGVAPPVQVLDRGEARAVIVIPPEFSRHLKSNQPATVQVLVDGSDGNNARIVRNSMRATTEFFLRTSGLQTQTQQIFARIRLWFNPGRQESLYIVPGVFAVTLWIFPSLITAIYMAREKEQGTLIQVYASSLSAAELLLGKGLAYWLVALAQAVLVMGVGCLLFGLGFVGDPTPFLVGTPLFLAVAVLFGLFVGVRSQTQSAAVQGTATIGFLTAYLLSGFIYPVDNIPFPLSVISWFVPARYFIEVTRDAFVRGGGWPGVWHVPLLLLVLGLLLFRAAEQQMHRMQLGSGAGTAHAGRLADLGWLDRLVEGRFWSLAIKEFNQTLSNKQLIFLLLFPPTIQLLVFGFSLNPEVTHLKLGVLDYANSHNSRELVAAFVENRVFEARYTADQDQLADQVQQGKLTAGLVIPPDFDRRLDRGQPTEVQILIDAVDANTAGIASGYASQIVNRYNRLLLGNTAAPLIQPEITILYNPGLISSWFFVPGVLGLIITLMGSLVAAAALVREKETGTLEQLLMTPAAEWEIIVAKVLPIYLLLLGDVFLALGLARLVFQLPFRGSLLLYGLLSSLAIFVGIGIGMLLATISRSQIQTQLTAFFVNIPVNILSGTVTPIESMPALFQFLALFDPLRHYVAIIRGMMLKGVGLEVLWPNALALVAFAVILLTVSVRQFRSQLS